MFYERRKKINWEDKKCNGRNRAHCKEDGKEGDRISYNGIFKTILSKV